MTPYRRHLLTEIIENKKELTAFSYFINREIRCEEICAWLIKNKLTGNELWGFWKVECHKKYDVMIKKILLKMDSEKRIPLRQE